RDIEASISRISTRERTSPAKTAKGERRKSTLAEMHARVSEDDGSFVGEQRPATVTANVRNSRFGKPGSRQASDVAAGPSSDHRSGQTLTTRDRTMTPQAERFGTPRTANATAQSFMLPDLPNLTELMSGVYQDGTPVFSRSAKAKSRFTSGSYPRQGGNRGPARYQLDSVPVPQEEKAIFASLHLFKEKVAQLEQDKAEAEQQISEYENEVIELRTRLDAQENQRRSDSALGSSDEESKKKIKWQAEKTKLEASVQSLQNRLDRAERKASVAEISTKRITQERDNLVTQVGVAFYNSEELKTENEALRKVNETLRGEVDTLRSENERLLNENEDLQADVSDVHRQHREDTQQWNKKESDLRRKVGITDAATI
ncbi:hypothetical protein LTS18_014582, partial [Coniosporium uncinatum]